MYANGCTNKPSVGSNFSLLGKNCLLSPCCISDTKMDFLDFFFFSGGALLKVYSLKVWTACECFILLNRAIAKRDRKQALCKHWSSAHNSSVAMNESPGKCLSPNKKKGGWYLGQRVRAVTCVPVSRCSRPLEFMEEQ